jgi:hypothetical protein
MKFTSLKEAFDSFQHHEAIHCIEKILYISENTLLKILNRREVTDNAKQLDSIVRLLLSDQVSEH